MTPACECESCRIGRDVREMPPTTEPSEVAFTVYWSLTCARCGARRPYVGLVEMEVCEACDAAIAAEVAADRKRQSEDFVLDRLQQIREANSRPFLGRRRARILVDEAIDRLIGLDR